jgi:hypothetical protein
MKQTQCLIRKNASSPLAIAFPARLLDVQPLDPQAVR